MPSPHVKPARQRRPRSRTGRGRAVAQILAEDRPHVPIPLRHRNAFELLAAVILSAQCTDVRVNQVTPALFARYPSPTDLAAAEPADVEGIVHSTGFFRAKSKVLIAMAAALEDRFGGEVPGTMDELVTLPGVGRKTASVVLGQWFGVPAIAVDTHVLRLSRRLGLTDSSDPVRVEADLKEVWPRNAWADTGLRLIMHGREVCPARRPRCEICALANACPSAKRP
ncbi:MAG: endonuclease III [Thermoleophilia bacterium]|nr:endonuclease III [Thermoleophilia bacterium]